MDFDRKRAEGFKAMERFETSREHLRTPTPAWAGFGLSKTSPLVLDNNKMPQWTRPVDNPLFDKYSTTSLMDALAAPDRNLLSRFKDIHSLLTHIKLEHYISEFCAFLQAPKGLTPRNCGVWPFFRNSTTFCL